MRIDITPLAEQDLEAIGDYIAANNPARAVSFIEELRVQLERIARNPPGYQQRSELGKAIRSCAYGRYVIFFSATTQAITVLRILHGARDLLRILHTEK